MDGSYVDLDALQDDAAASVVDILPAECDVHRDACMVSKKWWHSFGYNYVLDAPAETPSGDHHEIVVEVEVMKIVNENLTTSEGQDAVETVAGATPDDAEQEKRVEV
jgi:hypothetical protein